MSIILSSCSSKSLHTLDRFFLGVYFATLLWLVVFCWLFYLPLFLICQNHKYLWWDLICLLLSGPAPANNIQRIKWVDDIIRRGYSFAIHWYYLIFYVWYVFFSLCPIGYIFLMLDVRRFLLYLVEYLSLYFRKML